MKYKVPHIRVEKRDEGTWNIFLANSFVGREHVDMTEHDYDFTEEVVIDKKGIKNIITAIYDVVKKQSGDDIEIKINYIENKPQFKMTIVYVTPGHRKENVLNVNKFEFTPSYSALFSAHKYTREEDQYLYELGYRFGFPGYYEGNELEDFCKQLEKEIK